MPTSPPPVQVVCAIILRDHQVLIAQRPPDKRLGGYWEFPGGKIDPGEDAETALHRELQEELACTVTIRQTLPTVHHAYPWCQVEMIPFVCHLRTDSPAPTALEHTALLWLPWGDLPQHDLAPADLPLITSFDPRQLAE
jgi:8-oxo-dGTP diphosphatase